MKVKYKDILLFTGTGLGEKRFPAAMQVAILGNAEVCSDALKIYVDTYNQLLEEYTKKDENGEPVTDEKGEVVIADNEAWVKALKELDDSERELPITMVPMAVYERCFEDPKFDIPNVAETAAMKFFIEM